MSGRRRDLARTLGVCRGCGLVDMRKSDWTTRILIAVVALVGMAIVYLVAVNAIEALAP